MYHTLKHKISNDSMLEVSKLKHKKVNVHNDNVVEISENTLIQKLLIASKYLGSIFNANWKSTRSIILI